MKIIEKIKKYIDDNRKVCIMPFAYCEISIDGNVFLCCPAYLRFVAGNIMMEDFLDIWNGKRINRFRTRFLSGNDRLCNKNLCSSCKIKAKDIKKNFYDEEGNVKIPKVKMSNDAECNIACITCRDNIIRNTPEQENNLEKIKNNMKSIIPQIKEMSFLGTGDPLASRFTSQFMREVVQQNKDIKLEICSNGVLATKEKLIELGIYDNIDIMKFSLHSATKETYEKICKYGNYEKVMKNIEWISKDSNIRTLILVFTITNLNYKEIPDFLELCRKYNAIPNFILYRYWGTEFGKNLEEAQVWKKSHSEYKNFKKIIKSVYNNPENKNLPCWVFPDEIRKLK